MNRRRKKSYFEQVEGAPKPLNVSLVRKVNFREVDLMRIAWHGHYLAYFEEVSSLLRDRCGLSYQRFLEEGLAVPIVQSHVDYRLPLLLDECFTIEASMIWTEAARINIEYRILKESGELASTGYTVQLFMDTETRQPLYAYPPLLEETRRRWASGGFEVLQ